MHALFVSNNKFWNLRGPKYNCMLNTDCMDIYSHIFIFFFLSSSSSPLLLLPLFIGMTLNVYLDFRKKPSLGLSKS